MIKYLLLVLIITMSLGFAEPGELDLSELVEIQTTHYSQREYRHGEDGMFFIRKIPFSGSDTYTTSFYIPGDVGTYSYYDKDQTLKTAKLEDGLLPKDSFIFIDTDKHHVILGQPYTYKSLGYGTIDSVNQGVIKIKKVSNQWLVTYLISLTHDAYGVFWGVNSSEVLVDLTKPNLAFIWSGYDLSTNARLDYDGYHFKTPSTYKPYTKNAYWRIPSDYVVNSLIKTGGALASDIMGNGLLQIDSLNISEDGSLLSLPESSWLKKDYDIDNGFFDTRFNADTTETYLVAYKKFGKELYRVNYLKLAERYLEHIESCHYDVSTEDMVGILVMDYSKDHKAKANHSSLNHQAQAIHLFLNLYDFEKDERYLNAAIDMINGIKITRDQWIMQNGNLAYAYMPDGSMGLVDYPYLTYNDLLLVQKDLLALNGFEDPDINHLIVSKKKWMDDNGVKNYKK